MLAYPEWVNDLRTLDELDPPAWGPPSADSHLVMRTHELRQKQLAEFTVEDLRLMIGQHVGLDYLVPRAIALLEENPLAEGDLFPGDLLEAVLRVGESYWLQRPEHWWSVKAVVDDLFSRTDEIRTAAGGFLRLAPLG
jgi:hypothetical protein